MSHAQLVAGAATVDITPENPEGMYLAGFACGRRAIGVAEPLEAGVLYLSDGHQEIVLCTVAAIGLMYPLVLSIRERVESIEDKKKIIICATHTHSAPDTMGIWGPGRCGSLCLKSGVDHSWRDGRVDKLAKAIDQSKAQARPAKLHAASFDIDPSWTRNDRTGGGRYDDAVALALDDEIGPCDSVSVAWADEQPPPPPPPPPLPAGARHISRAAAPGGAFLGGAESCGRIVCCTNEVVALRDAPEVSHR